jgi:hypothetical protein
VSAGGDDNDDAADDCNDCDADCARFLLDNLLRVIFVAAGVFDLLVLFFWGLGCSELCIGH